MTIPAHLIKQDVNGGGYPEIAISFNYLLPSNCSIKNSGMKSFLFIACAFSFLSFNKLPGSCFPVCRSYTDTGHSLHVLDGLITEWQAGQFHLSEDSTVEYALDNDDKNLYVAMTVPDFGEQMKIMRNGMKLFIDLKGKKKEGKGIEFPIRETNNPGINNSNYNSANPGSEPEKKFDKKTTRNIMALGIVALKLFGLNHEEEEQGLRMPGSANIAFKWDESDVMHIEYNIPLNLLGEPSSLNQKDISLGWKINGFERPQGEHNSGNTENNEGRGRSSRGMSGGGGRSQYGGSREFGQRSAANYRKIDPDEMRKEQSFWARYVIDIPSKQKAF